MPESDRLPPPDPAHVADLIGQLAALQDGAYADALAVNITEPDADEQAAFRSAELAQRSLVACRFLIENVNATIRRKSDESGKAWVLRAEHFRSRVGMERRLLEAVVAGLRAEKGILSSAPNPRGRAMRTLARQHPKEFLELVRQEQEAAKARTAAEKEQRKRRRREQRDL